MAIQWGPYDGSGAGAHRVGIDISVSGNTLTARYYMGAAGGVQDNQKLHRSGAITGDVNYYANLPFGGGTQLITTATRAVSPGQTLTFVASLTGVYSGARPSVTVTFTVPGTVPGAPVRPSVRNVTASSIELFSTAPSSNGGLSIDAYQWNWARNSAFTVGNASLTKTSNGLVHTITGLLANTTYYVRIRARNAAGYGPWSNVRQVTTTVNTPHAPTNLVATRVNDGNFSLSWSLTDPQSSTRPVANVRIYRHDNVTGQYALIATVGAVTAYSDQTTQANRRYRYRVQAVNAGGSTAFAYSDYVVTTPAAPTGVNAVRSGNNNRVNFTRAASYPTNIDIQYRAGTGSWTTLTTLPPDGDNFYNHSGADPAQAATYRVRATSGALASPWVTTNSIIVFTPPNKPTDLAPSIVTYQLYWDPQGQHTLTWRHNPIDGTSQTAYQIRSRLVGASSWNTRNEVISDVSRAVIVPFGWSAGNDYEWQVRTKGDHPDWSPWSDTRVTRYRSAPTVSLIYPQQDTVHESSRLQVSWSYHDPNGTAQSGWVVSLMQTNPETLQLEEIERRSGNNNLTNITLNTRMEDGDRYTVRVQVRAGNGLWNSIPTQSSQDTSRARFTVSYPEPDPAIITPTWLSDSGAVELQTSNPPTDPVAVTNDIYRAIIPYDDLPTNERGTCTVRPENIHVGDNPPLGDIVNVNLAINPSFEGTDISMYRGYNFSNTVMRANPPGSTDHALLAVPSSNTGRLGLWFYQGIGGIIGETAYISVDILMGDSVDMRENFSGDIRFQIGTSTTIVSNVPFLHNHEWQRVYAEVPITATSPSHSVYIGLVGDFSGDLAYYQVFFDNLVITKNPPIGYFDGDTPGDDTYDYSWADPALAPNSTSLRTLSARQGDYIWIDTSDEGTPKAWSNEANEWVAISETPQWRLIAEGVPANSSILDPTAPVKALLLYRADATTALPSTSRGEISGILVPNSPDEDAMWLSGGPGFGIVGRFPCEPSITMQSGLRHKRLHAFAGREYPVEYTGTGLYKRGSVSGVLSDKTSSRRVLEYLFQLPGEHLYRDFTGERFFCSVSNLQITRDPNIADISHFSFTIEKVDYEDGVISDESV